MTIFRVFRFLFEYFSAILLVVCMAIAAWYTAFGQRAERDTAPPGD